jgi:hypothetical protein
MQEMLGFLMRQKNISDPGPERLRAPLLTRPRSPGGPSIFFTHCRRVRPLACFKELR